MSFDPFDESETRTPGQATAPELPIRQQGPDRKPGPNDGMISAEREGRLMTEEEEQALRDHFGYPPTERRSKMERDLAAQRMRSKAKGDSPDEPLPADIEAVWGKGKLNAQGESSADTARYLIERWGEERFRRSALHQAALEAGGVAAPVRPLIPASGPCQLIVPRGVKCKGCGKVH